MEEHEKSEDRILNENILEGIRKAVRQLYERVAARDGEVVISRDGQVVTVKAKELLK
ncbi:MAG: hypothetical protein ABIO46_15495 [Chitinophagales bacterium]